VVRLTLRSAGAAPRSTATWIRFVSRFRGCSLGCSSPPCRVSAFPANPQKDTGLDAVWTSLDTSSAPESGRSAVRSRPWPPLEAPDFGACCIFEGFMLKIISSVVSVLVSVIVSLLDLETPSEHQQTTADGIGR
jgi:hypothetical protein